MWGISCGKGSGLVKDWQQWKMSIEIVIETPSMWQIVSILQKLYLLKHEVEGFSRSITFNSLLYFWYLFPKYTFLAIGVITWVATPLNDNYFENIALPYLGRGWKYMLSKGAVRHHPILNTQNHCKKNFFFCFSAWS